MFSARAFFFTALLVLVASTSANPVQSPLEQYSTPWINNHSPAFLGCDGLQSASFKDGSYKPKLERVDGGTNACVYKFKPGWPQKGGESVGKTLKSGGDFNNQAGRNEIDTLQRINEFHAHEKDSEGRDWIVMKAQPGKWLSNTAEYKTIVQKLEAIQMSCHGFYRGVYEAVYSDAKRYISKYGCVHRGNAEMGESNVLIDFDAYGPVAHLVDWADTNCSQDNKPKAKALARKLCEHYAESASPVGKCGGVFGLEDAREYCAFLDIE